MKKKIFETEFAGKKLKVEFGKLANQADSSCTVQYGDTVVLATAVMGNIRDGIDYFPLSIEYEEKLYAVGKIKGSRWIKREGRPSEEAVLTGRLIDRSIRPLFPKQIKNEVQVVLTVLSYDLENDSDMVALIAASMALSTSSIPWAGPLAGLRMAKVDGTWEPNPTFKQRKTSDAELIVAGMDDKVLMIEAESMEMSEDDCYKGIEQSLPHLTGLIKFINKMVSEIGKEKVKMEDLVPALDDEESPESIKELKEKASKWIKENVPAALFSKGGASKMERREKLDDAKEKLMEYLEGENIGKDRRKKALPMFSEFMYSEVTRAIIEEDKRVDGRKLTDIRQLTSEIGILPRTHGTGLFSRGETQVLSIVTLGSPGDEQMLEGMEENGTKRFMHHYNFPPFSVGEAGRMFGPGRRDIGHGALAEKAIKRMLPDKESFPYTIRVVSETLGSNGSSSMASTCGTSLALMDAGVPIKKAVAGIAMGLASDDKGNWKVLTDLQDVEDGEGGMDFKITGTRDGITAIQLDTKTLGLNMDIVKQTLTQGLKARMEVLDVMDAAISAPSKEMSQYAPRIISFNINPDKIREVIGPGGKIINEIIDKTGVQIDIEQDGLVMVTATNGEDGTKAVDWIKSIIREVEVGEEFEGKVARIMDFGAIVEILPNQDGMVHISEMAHSRVEKVEDVVKLGDVVKVKVMKVEDNGRIGLSMKALLPRPERTTDRGFVPRGGKPSPSQDKKGFFNRGKK